MSRLSSMGVDNIRYEVSGSTTIGFVHQDVSKIGAIKDAISMTGKMIYIGDEVFFGNDKPARRYALIEHNLSVISVDPVYSHFHTEFDGVYWIGERLQGTISYLNEMTRAIIRNYASSSVDNNSGEMTSNVYPLLVSEEVQERIEQRYGKDKILFIVAIKAFNFVHQPELINSDNDIHEQRLIQIEKILGRAPPELADWSLIISTDLKLTQGNVAVCNVESTTGTLHPYFFELSEEQQIAILYHQLILHLLGT
jgi:hypothetical protein